MDVDVGDMTSDGAEMDLGEVSTGGSASASSLPTGGGAMRTPITTERLSLSGECGFGCFRRIECSKIVLFESNWSSYM